ncbi:hypothetical protein [Sphingosinicella soli]|uniref:Uncharacterized protein n=1 Tax=Sphingosinicella soli TaxID=333708 RepID=A0A7W7B151_9SPHN|nr:hypothetical protein [Sphingosinicella soli]MBB4632126.1 hypothetical protein [Sphingosinicella soli]
MRSLIPCLLLIASPAAAQQAADVPGDPAQWFAAQENAAEAHAPDLESLRQEVLDRARWSTTTHACTTLTRIDPYGLQPATADRLVSEGLKAGAFVGAWTFYARTDCAETPLLRFLYIAEKNGRHLLLVVNRGEAISTPSQMRETSKLAAKAAWDRAKQQQPMCEVTTVGMRQTRIAAADGDLSPMQFGTRFAGGWSEAWDFVACGRRATVTVRFDADGKGGASARVTEVTLS